MGRARTLAEVYRHFGDGDAASPLQARIDPGGEFDTAIAFVVEDGRITRMYAMRNPHKLGRLDDVAELRRG